MPFAIEDKLVIAVSSSALFDLTESDKVFREQGPSAYKQFQEENLDNVLGKGVAFPFVKRFLSLNEHFKQQEPVEVVLLSRNSPATGKRVFRSIQYYGLGISRATFLKGDSPYPYIPAFNASLFLSANDNDVRCAIAAGYPAGQVLPSTITDEESDKQLRIAFDFDGVIADDEAERIFQNQGLNKFHEHESEKSTLPHSPGLLADLFKKLAALQNLEAEKENKDPSYESIIHTSVITARSAPAHERVITTLEEWGITPNKTFFLGGMEKKRILSVFKPHIFFDDQKTHLKMDGDSVPMVHIPFGITNKLAK